MAAMLPPTHSATTTDEHGRLVVTVQAPSMDRPECAGWVLPDTPKGRALAQRLACAIDTGDAWRPLQVRTDVNGHSWLHGASWVMGRTMDADLRALGH